MLRSQPDRELEGAQPEIIVDKSDLVWAATPDTLLNVRPHFDILMKKRYEYKFVRLGEGVFMVKSKAKDQYQREIHAHASEGWRLVQIFAPSVGIEGWAKYYELIFEREVTE